MSENVYLAGHRAHTHAHQSPFVHATFAGRSRHAARGAHHEDLYEPGNVAFFPAGLEHSHAAQDNGVHSITIDILPTYASAFIDMGAQLSKPFDYCDVNTFRLAMKLREEIRDPDALSGLQVNALITDICVSLVRLARDADSTSIPRWLKRLVKDIDERYKENLSLDELAAGALVHPVHLSRAFRRYYGVTLRDYIRRLRIKEARRLLLTRSWSLAEIAVEVGYYDESHFSKAFIRTVGTTPSRYRHALKAT